MLHEVLSTDGLSNQIDLRNYTTKHRFSERTIIQIKWILQFQNFNILILTLITLTAQFNTAITAAVTSIMYCYKARILQNAKLRSLLLTLNKAGNLSWF
jgi:hypothetical protein